MAVRTRTPAERERESRLTRGSRLAKGAWRLTRRDPALIGLALFGTAMVLLALFLEIRVRWEEHGGVSSPLDAPLALPFAYLTVFVGVLFAVAFSAAADAAFDGNPMSMREALAEARERLRQIAHWSLVTFVVAIALVELIGELAGTALPFWLISVPWGLATAFVIPIVAIDAEPAELALRRSARLARHRWVEEVGGFLTLGFFMVLAGIVAALSIAAIDRDTRPGLGLLVLLALIALVVGFVLVTAAGQAFAVSLYRHARGDARGADSIDSLEDPPAPRRPSGGWIAGRTVLVVIGVVAVGVAGAAIIPDRDGRFEDPSAGRFEIAYPTSYGVQVEPGAPLVYGERRVGVIRDCELRDDSVVLFVEMDPAWARQLAGQQTYFDQYRGHYFLRIGPPPGQDQSRPS